MAPGNPAGTKIHDVSTQWMLYKSSPPNVTGSGKIDLKAHNTKIELLVPADSPMFGEYSNGQSASIAHSVAKK